MACAGLAVLAFAGSALAADEMKKGPTLQCPSCDWTGFYIGANVGGGLGRISTDDSVSLIPPGGIASVLNPVSSAEDTRSAAGVLGGGQIGFNWQTGSWVFGFEADGNATSQEDRLKVQNFIASTVVVAPATLNWSDEQKIKWLVTARGRVGWAHDYSLWYVTGGAAFGRVESNYSFVGTGSPVFATPGLTESTGTTKTGWTVGGGVETSLGWMSSLAKNVSLKVEYLYVDLGSVDKSFSIPLTATPSTVYSFTTSNHIQDHIIRVGLNYRFFGGKD